MDFSVCTQCGVEIEGKGIHFRNHVFCGDECCEEYEAEFAKKDAPVIDELVDDEVEIDDLEDELGYREDVDDDDDDPLDDEFDIKPDDF